MHARTPAGAKQGALVLAAGQGRRLGRLIHALYGRVIPQQFAALEGGNGATLEGVAQ